MATPRITYAATQYIDNVDFIPDYVDGKFEIPIIRPEPYIEIDTWIPFNQAGYGYKREEKGVHFFVHDYFFNSLWTKREKYRHMLPQYKAVMTPDYSLYTNWPVMVQIWNHYRKHLIGAWMQSIGCRVYPSVSWSDDSSFDWCFDGEPRGGTVCISSVGTQQNKETRKLFMAGYEMMMDVLYPETILFYGKVPKECEGNIIPIESFQDQLKKKVKKNDQA